jgi:PAS domain S-box-containing protein
MRHMHDIYRRMVETLPLCVYLAEFEPVGRWEFVSPQIEALTGYTPEEWLERPNLWLESLHPDDRGRVLDEEKRHKALPRGTQWTHEYRLVRRDGGVVWVRDRALLVQVEDGRQLVEGVLTDIGGERLETEGDPQPDVFRITCADCGRVWASVIAETACGRCGSREVALESMDEKTRELAKARRDAELLLTGIMGHLERLGTGADDGREERPGGKGMVGAV